CTRCSTRCSPHRGSRCRESAARRSGADVRRATRGKDRAMPSRALLALLAIGPACADRGEAPRERPPNVLLVIADDFGVDVFDAPEDSPLRARTPTLDRLRAEGVTFTRTWANPVCSPTRATILTGRYAFR